MAIKYVLVRKSGQYALDESDMLAINSLLWQLKSTAPQRTLDDVHNLVHHNILVVALQSAGKARGHIVGMGTLILATRLAGRHGLIEDIVVDLSMRGRGVGKGIMKTLISHAQQFELTHIDFTSSDERVVANKLCRELGFRPLKKNPYRLALK